MTNTLDIEQVAIDTDAKRRVSELFAVRTALLPDRDDPMVLSELTAVESELRSAIEAVRPPGVGRALDGTARHPRSGRISPSEVCKAHDGGHLEPDGGAR
jgi:hypothetical protein